MNATLVKWRDPVPMEIDEALLSAAGGSRLLAEILARRGITSADQALPFLHPEKYTPIPASDFTGIAQAADYIINAIEKKKNKIFINWIWKYLMIIIRVIPESRFKKMKM